MLKPLISFVTGTLCTLGLWCCQEPAGEKRVVVGVVSSDDQEEAHDSAQLVAEMQELRAQLVAVLGPLHPTTRMLDARILQMSQPRSIAELVVEPTEEHRLYEARNLSAWAAARGPSEGWSLAALPVLPGMPAEWNEQPPRWHQEAGDHSAGFTLSDGVLLARTSAEPTTGLGQRIAELRQQWSEAKDEEQQQTVLANLRTSISEQFDADLQRRRDQVASLESKLDELRKQIEKREARRDEFVDVLTKHTEMEWEGISLRKNNSPNLPFGSVYRQAPAPASAPRGPAPAAPVIPNQ